jgi:hypothetical protein
MIARRLLILSNQIFDRKVEVGGSGNGDLFGEDLVRETEMTAEARRNRQIAEDE